MIIDELTILATERNVDPPTRDLAFRTMREIGHLKAKIESGAKVIAALREKIRPLAEIGLWRDHYPDGPDIVMPEQLRSYFTPGQVREARGAIEQKAGK